MTRLTFQCSIDVNVSLVRCYFAFSVVAFSVRVRLRNHFDWWLNHPSLWLTVAVAVSVMCTILQPVQIAGSVELLEVRLYGGVLVMIHWIRLMKPLKRAQFSHFHPNLALMSKKSVASFEALTNERICLWSGEKRIFMKEKVSLRASFSDGTAKFDVDVQLRSLGFSDWALCYARNFTEIVNQKIT